MSSTTEATAAAPAAHCDQCDKAAVTDAQQPVRILRCMHTVCAACLVDMVGVAGAPGKPCSAAGCGTASAAEQHAVWLPAQGDLVRQVDKVPCDNTRCPAADGDTKAPASHHCEQCVKRVDAGRCSLGGTIVAASVFGEGTYARARADARAKSTKGKNLCAVCAKHHEENDDYADHMLIVLTTGPLGKAVHGLCTLGCDDGPASRASSRCGECGTAGCDACLGRHAGCAHAAAVRPLDKWHLEAVEARLADGGAKAKELDKWFDDYEKEDSAARVPFERANSDLEEMRQQLHGLVDAKVDEERAKVARLTPAGAAGHEERARLRAHVKKVADRLAHVSSPLYAAKWRAPLRSFVSHGATGELDKVQKRIDAMPRRQDDDETLEQNKKQLIDERRIAAVVSKVRGALDLPSAAAAAGGGAAAAAVDKLPEVEPGELMEESPPPQAAHDPAPARAGSKRPASSDTHSELENGVPQAKRQTNDAQTCLVCGSVPNEAVRFTCQIGGMCAARLAQAEKRWPASQHFCYGCHVPAITSSEQIPPGGRLCNVCDEEKWTKDMDAAAVHLAYLVLLIRSEAKRTPAPAAIAAKLRQCDAAIAGGKCTLAEVKQLAEELGITEEQLEPPDNSKETNDG